MSDPLEIRFTITREEVLSSIRWLTWRQSRVTLALSALFVLLLSSGIAMTARSGNLIWAAFFVLAYALTLAYSFLVAPARAYGRFPAHFRDGEQVWRFTEEGVEHRGPTAEAKFLWSSWLEYGESRDCFLLFPQKRLAHMFPKRAFGSPEEIDRFRDLARRKIPAS